MINLYTSLLIYNFTYVSYLLLLSSPFLSSLSQMVDCCDRNGSWLPGIVEVVNRENEVKETSLSISRLPLIYNYDHYSNWRLREIFTPGERGTYHVIRFGIFDVHLIVMTTPPFLIFHDRREIIVMDINITLRRSFKCNNSTVFYCPCNSPF